MTGLGRLTRQVAVIVMRASRIPEIRCIHISPVQNREDCSVPASCFLRQRRRLDCSRFGKVGWIPACPGIWRLEILWQNSRLCGMLTKLVISFPSCVFLLPELGYSASRR